MRMYFSAVGAAAGGGLGYVHTGWVVFSDAICRCHYSELYPSAAEAGAGGGLGYVQADMYVMRPHPHC